MSDVPYHRQQQDYTCGPAVLKMVLAWYGKQEEEEVIAEKLGTNPKTGTTRKAMVSFLKQGGVKCRPITKATFDDLFVTASSNSIVVVNYVEPTDNEGHYALAIHASETTIVLHDPHNGAFFEMSNEEFRKRWEGHHTRDKSRGWMVVVDQAA